MKECPNCKSMMEDDALFCGECGTKFEVEQNDDQVEETLASSEKKCIHCGETIEEDSAFCPYCGKAQVAEEKQSEKEELEDSPAQENPVEQPTYEWEEEEVQSRTWLWVILGLLFIGSIGGGYYLWTKNNIQPTSEVLSDSTEVFENTVDVKVKQLPSVQKLGTLFNEMSEGNLSALLDYGFILVDKQTEKQTTGYDGDDEEHEVIKEEYTLNCEFYDVETSKNIQTILRVDYVYSPSMCGPSMTVKCDMKTWDTLKAGADNSLKPLSNDNGCVSFFLDVSSFITFEKKGIIDITSECSISW